MSGGDTSVQILLEGEAWLCDGVGGRCMFIEGDKLSGDTIGSGPSGASLDGCKGLV